MRPYWDVHRHRIAPQIGRILDHQMHDGRVQIHAGRIKSYFERDNRVEVAYRERHSGAAKQLQVDRVINCTGPEGDCRKLASPLLTDLLRHGLVRPDPLFLGLDTAEDGAVLDASGVASDFLFAAGPARKGSHLETVAVPELRLQVAELASRLLFHYQPPCVETAGTDRDPVYVSAMA